MISTQKELVGVEVWAIVFMFKLNKEDVVIRGGVKVVAPHF